MRRIFCCCSLIDVQEVAELKHKLQQQKAQLESIKETNKLLTQQQETIILAELRTAVHQLKNLEVLKNRQEEFVDKVAENLGIDAEEQIRKQAEEKVTEVLQKIDYKSILEGLEQGSDDTSRK